MRTSLVNGCRKMTPEFCGRIGRPVSRHLALISLFQGICLLTRFAYADAAPQTPNVVIIHIDDMGYADIGPFGAKGYPLREGKQTSWDGGVREPTLMHWPGHVPAGKVCDAPLMTIDILPTVAHVIGARHPDHKIDGLNISEMILGRSTESPHEVLLFYYGSNNLEALRSGKWKLELPWRYPSLNGRPGGRGGMPARYESLTISAPELYDLDADPGQKNSVAAEYPDVLKQMLAYAEQASEELGDDLTHRTDMGPREPGKLPGQGAASAGNSLAK